MEYIDDASRAQAETTPAANGEQPSKPAETTATAPDPKRALESGNLDEIRALMRASDGVLAKPRDPWSDLTPPETSEEKPESETETAEAEPGEDEEEENTEETEEEDEPGEDEEEEQEQEQEEETEAAKEKETAKGKEKTKEQKAVDKDPKRVRVQRFSPEDRAIIAHMANMDTPSYEGARAELIASGTLKPKAESTPTTVADAKAEAAKVAGAESRTAIETKTAEIADLEKQIADAATAFDTQKLGQLTIKHNRALSELGKLENKAEQEQTQAKARAQTQLEAVIAETESDAVALFPDAGVKGTPLHNKIVELMKAAPPAAFKDPDYPLTFAAKAARAIGYQPASAEQKVAKLPPKVVPKKPAKMAPASGSTPPSVTKKSTVATRAQEALASNDPEKIRLALRESGTRTLEL